MIRNILTQLNRNFSGPTHLHQLRGILNNISQKDVAKGLVQNPLYSVPLAELRGLKAIEEKRKNDLIAPSLLTLGVAVFFNLQLALVPASYTALKLSDYIHGRNAWKSNVINISLVNPTTLKIDTLFGNSFEAPISEITFTPTNQPITNDSLSYTLQTSHGTPITLTLSSKQHGSVSNSEVLESIINKSYNHQGVTITERPEQGDKKNPHEGPKH